MIMIASLRRRHRWIFLTLTAILPALVAAALLHRPEMPNMALPGELLAQPTGQALASGEGDFTSYRTQLSRYADAIGLTMGSSLRSPDVLVYFSAGASENLASLPDDAILLGALDPKRTNFYALEAHLGGRLLLYSLAHQELLDSAPLAPLLGADSAVAGENADTAQEEAAPDGAEAEATEQEITEPGGAA